MTGFRFLPSRDFVGGVGARSEECLHAVFGAVLLGVVGQHEQPGFMVLILPGLQKAIGCGQRGYVAGI